MPKRPPLPPPHPALKVSVVVPARNEEALVGSCLEALAEQEGVSPEDFEVLLVLDRCTDETEPRAQEVADAHPRFRLHFLDGPGKGSGHARRMGMELASARLLGLRRPKGLIASTDADTVVAPDWLAAQLRAVSRGALAVGGRIELAEDPSLPESIFRWHTERGRRRHESLLSEPDHLGKTEHWQFSGASLALTAKIYQEIGGLEPRVALEDEHLENVLRLHGVPIERLTSVHVTTSVRLEGRAMQGLAHDLAAVVAKLRDGERAIDRHRVGLENAQGSFCRKSPNEV
jgi:glucosyl-3-phosphoglycerate synthase